MARRELAGRAQASSITESSSKCPISASKDARERCHNAVAASAVGTVEFPNMSNALRTLMRGRLSGVVRGRWRTLANFFCCRETSRSLRLVLAAADADGDVGSAWRRRCLCLRSMCQSAAPAVPASTLKTRTPSPAVHPCRPDESRSHAGVHTPLSTYSRPACAASSASAHEHLASFLSGFSV
jgi:hypothetical protein